MTRYEFHWKSGRIDVVGAASTREALAKLGYTPEQHPPMHFWYEGEFCGND